MFEDGEQLGAAITLATSMAPSPRQGEHRCHLHPPGFAMVTYDLLVDDTWKVGKTSFCTLTTLASPGAGSAAEPSGSAVSP